MRWWQSFYWRSAAALFGIAAALAAAGVYLSLRTTRAYQDELEQRLNLKLAANLVKDSVVLADGRVVRDGLEHVFHTLMVINPRIEVYLLDPDGRILEYSAGEGVVRLDAVSLAPIGELLSADPRLPIRGDDPRHPGRLKTFSVAPVPAAGPLEGYLYVVLAGQEYESAVGLLGQSHILKLGAGAMVAATLLALAGGLWLFGGLAGRLRRLDAKIERARPRQVGDPDHGGQDADRAGDEIDRLDASFDRMQRLIDRQVQELRELDGLRRELIANVSHDLRTPLASLQGYLETVLLKSDQLSEAEQVRYLEMTLDQLESAIEEDGVTLIETMIQQYLQTLIGAASTGYTRAGLAGLQAVQSPEKHMLGGADVATVAQRRVAAGHHPALLALLARR